MIICVGIGNDELFNIRIYHISRYGYTSSQRVNGMGNSYTIGVCRATGKSRHGKDVCLPSELNV